MNMTYRGRVKNGVVVLEDGAALPDDTEVAVQPVTGETSHQLASGLLRFSGIVKGWPRDMAKNHDHYLHGAPKRP